MIVTDIENELLWMEQLLVQLPGSGIIAVQLQVFGQVIHCDEGARVVAAKDSLVSFERCLVQFERTLEIAQHPQVGEENPLMRMSVFPHDRYQESHAFVHKWLPLARGPPGTGRPPGAPAP